MNLIEKYQAIIKHPILSEKGSMMVLIETIPVMVDPITRTIEKDTSRNTTLYLWMEINVSSDYDQKSFYGQGGDENGVYGNAVWECWDLESGGFTYDQNRRVLGFSKPR